MSMPLVVFYIFFLKMCTIIFKKGVQLLLKVSFFFLLLGSVVLIKLAKN